MLLSWAAAKEGIGAIVVAASRPKQGKQKMAAHGRLAVRRASSADQPSLIPSFSNPLAIFQPSPSTSVVR
ncbi:hypothetical protein BM1_04142 [Bipolaris maydis]|nr:hypothetical protein BM1_04142 [Bipolaris maydis]